MTNQDRIMSEVNRADIVKILKDHSIDHEVVDQVTFNMLRSKETRYTSSWGRYPSRNSAIIIKKPKKDKVVMIFDFENQLEDIYVLQEKPNEKPKIDGEDFSWSISTAECPPALKIEHLNTAGSFAAETQRLRIQKQQEIAMWSHYVGNLSPITYPEGTGKLENI